MHSVWLTIVSEQGLVTRRTKFMVLGDVSSGLTIRGMKRNHLDFMVAVNLSTTTES